VGGTRAGSAPARLGTKITVALRGDLEARQPLNVTSFLVSGLGRRHLEVIGELYHDADWRGVLAGVPPAGPGR
jgi:hypothetical protein